MSAHKRFLRNNGLSLVLTACFLLLWAAQAWCGWKVAMEDAAIHGRGAPNLGGYLTSGHFWQATGENWESEFLQMGFYVLLTCFLYQKGSAESNDPDEPEERADKKRYGFIRRNSLSLALGALFIGSFVIHAEGGLIEENEQRAEHHQPRETMTEFLTGSRFWFESFQNWQSEFLAVLSIVVLTIFLRQDGSPESKAVDEPDSKTGC